MSVTSPLSLPFQMLFTAFFSLAMGASLFAQDNYNFTFYTRADGLASGTITGISKDSTGFLWLFSENGLTRFDGYDFKIFQYNPNDPGSVSSPYVNDLLIDSAQHMLFRTYNSISKYNPSDGTFKKLISYYSNEYFISWAAGTYDIWVLVKGSLIRVDAGSEKTTYFKLPNGFTPRNTHSVFEHNNRVYIIGQNNILRFTIKDNQFSLLPVQYPDSTSFFLPKVPIQFYCQDGKPPGFYAQGQLYQWNESKNNFRVLTSEKKFQLSISYTSQVTLDDKFTCASTNKGKLQQVNIKTGEVKLIDLLDDYHITSGPYIKAVYKGSHGNIWLATNGTAIYRYSPYTGKLDSLKIENQEGENLSANNYYLYEDEKGIVWISLAGTGLIKAEPSKKIFPSFRPSSYLHSSVSDNIRGITEFTKDSLFINTINGVLLFNRSEQQFSKISYDGYDFSGSAFSKIIADENNNLWIAGWQRQGLFYINTQTKKVTPLYPLLDKLNKGTASVRTMLIDTKGFLWIGTADNAILRIKISTIDYNQPEKAEFEVFNSSTLKNDALLFNIVFTIAENDNGDIYFGTQSGVYVYSYRLKKLTPLTFTSKTSLQSDVRTFYFDSNHHLWMGTNGGGLMKLNLQNGQIKTFTTKDGLPDNSIYTIVQDQKNNLWLGTNKGLCRFNPSQQSVRNFSLKDGIQNYEYNTNAACKLSTGELAFGGINGLNIFNPDSVQTLSDIPEIVITQFKVQETAKPIVTNTVRLNYYENYVSFQFAALNYLRNEENQYAYKLEGLDKDWIYCDNRRFTNYANLSPGQYTFRVKCSNANGVWNETGASMNFLIATPWYSTWWFSVLIFMTIISGIYAWYRYRLHQTLKFQAVRDRIGRDLHDEIGSTLQSIAFYSEVASKVVTEKAPEAQSMLTQISESTTNMMEAMSDIVWAINTRNDSFANIINRMRAFAVEVLEAKNCNVHFDISDILMHYNLEMEKRKNLYLIFKETINNAAKHSGCKNVWIKFHSEGDHLNLKITDDGKGFEIKNDFSGNGLFNIRKRASELKGDIKIISQPDQGTTVQLSFVP